MKRNYHTHHYLCKHASGNTEDYVKEAIKHNFDILGMSDHAPNNRVGDRNVRMDESEFDLYLKDIDEARLKYGDKITILKGLEVEFFYDHEDYYKELRKKVDYLIHGQHYISMTDSMNDLFSGFGLRTKDELLKYADILVDAMSSNYFDIFAHPDLYMCGYKDFDETALKVAHIICKAAIDNDVVLEFNANGFRRGRANTPQGVLQPYPRLEFWEIAKLYNCKTILNSDCHSPEILYDTVVKEAEEVYLSLGLNDVGILKLK
jgi:histidinol-phosphatase (PHP family)